MKHIFNRNLHHIFLLGSFILCLPSWFVDSFVPLQRASVQPTSYLLAHLITFDLDDTLFPVAPVIEYANNALFEHLHAIGYPNVRNEDFLASTKEIRTNLAKEGVLITYSELRKKTIRKEIEKQTNQVDQKIVEEAYMLWENHRHIGAEMFLYHDACHMLQQLKVDFEDVVIGAITNGKGNPMKMNSLKRFFDFCVSGEDENIFPLRKPHFGIYKAALDRYSKIQGKEMIARRDYIWIHVGDDLANDIGASAKAGAYAIWADLGVEYSQTASKRTSKSMQPAWSTATQEELDKRKMMNDEAQKLISARISRLSDLPVAIKSVSHSISNRKSNDPK